MTYKEYVAECEANGTEPLEMPKWRSEQARAATKPAKAEIVESHNRADEMQALLEEKLALLDEKLKAITPEPEVEEVQVPVAWGEDGSYRYYSEFKEHNLVMKSDRAIGPDGRLVTSNHRTIQFDDNHYSTTDPEIRDWIETEAKDHSTGRKEYGWHIFRDTTLKTVPQIKVTDGPKMSIPQQKHRYQDRPSPLHANA